MPKKNPLSPEKQQNEFKKETKALNNVNKKVVKETRNNFNISPKKKRNK